MLTLGPAVGTHPQTVLDECSQLVEPLSLVPIIKAQSRYDRVGSGGLEPGTHSCIAWS